MNNSGVGFASVGTNQATRMKNYIFAFVCVHIQTYSLYMFLHIIYTHTHIHTDRYICVHIHMRIYSPDSRSYIAGRADCLLCFTIRQDGKYK